MCSFVLHPPKNGEFHAHMKLRYTTGCSLSFSLAHMSTSDLIVDTFLFLPLVMFQLLIRKIV